MYQLPPKKKFGQNFLTDTSILEKIISSAGNLENKNILEIGGGSGNLTTYLLKAKPKKLLVVEIDEDYKVQSPIGDLIGWVNKIQVAKTIFLNPSTLVECK